MQRVFDFSKTACRAGVLCGAALSTLFAAPPAYPCSPMRFELMHPGSPSERANATAPEAPLEIDYSILRGSDKEKSTCARQGYLTVYIKPAGQEALDVRRRDTGYEFELVHPISDRPEYSAFESAPILPQWAVNGFLVYQFPWTDGAKRYQERLQLLLNVYTIRSGRRSEACLLRIVHPGGRTTNKPSKRKQQSCDSS